MKSKRFIGALALAVAACTDSGSPTQASIATATLNPQVVALRDFDAEMARISREDVPGFAGVTVDAQGTVTILLTDGRHANAARLALARTAALRGVSTNSARVRLVVYDFDQLYAWKLRLSALSANAGVVWVDVDEAINQVAVGVMSEEARQRVLVETSRLGIPSAAVTALNTGAPKDLVGTLQDRTRPLVGGLAVRLIPSPPLAQWCTLTLVARYDGADRILTNSHCGESYLSHDDGVIYQTDSMTVNGPPGSPTYADQVGEEYADPAPHFSMCTSVYEGMGWPFPGPGWPFCRYSDLSAYRRWDRTIEVARGRIARTLYPGYGQPGSLVVDTAYPYFSVESVPSGNEGAVGTIVQKVGATTGWTAGPITRTCVDVLYNGSEPKYLRCQWEAQLDADGGDSGAAIFVPGSYAGMVRLQGVLWAHSGSDTTRIFYSTVWGMNVDFGGFDFLDPNPPPPPAPGQQLIVTIEGVTQAKPNVSCEFTATVNGGTGGPYTIIWSKDQVQIGTGYTVTVSSASSYTLHVLAQDANLVGGSAQRVISISAGAPDCLAQ